MKKTNTIRWVQMRDTGELVARWGRHKASIIAEHGPLGLYFATSVNGKSIGGSNVLENSKIMAMEKLARLVSNDKDAQAVNNDLAKLFCTK